jgi:site-specific DNA-methyltransferase (adenine-specific)
MRKVTIFVGEAGARAKALNSQSFQAIACDPPYGLSFVGQRWDYAVPRAPEWAELLRVVRPGAPCFAFSSTRTYHRTAVEIEDAGFEMRDMFSWIYGKGMPKGANISKKIDEMLGGVREADGFVTAGAKEKKGVYAGAWGNQYAITKAATPEAKLWEGWNTTLKPCCEPAAVFCRPPEGTFAENALKHGVAGFFIDGARVGESGGTRGAAFKNKRSEITQRKLAGEVVQLEKGRWPADVAMDEEAARICDAQSKSGAGAKPFYRVQEHELDLSEKEYCRFFYSGKASTKERGPGNPHKTVKPVDLIRYLATICLPPKPERILVPFSGVGSEIIGCLLAGWPEVVGIELSAEYAEYAKKRIEAGLQDVEVEIA